MFLGGNRILDLLDNLEYFKSRGFLQSETGYKRSNAKKFENEDAVIHWKDCTNQQVYNRYRALYGTGLNTVRTKFNDTGFFIDEMGLVKENEEEDNLLKAYTNAVPGSIWLLKHKKYKNFLYVKCKEGWVVVRGGYLESTKPQPSHKFIEKHINRDTVFGDSTSSGHYIFQ